jgi:hypothetical protein
MSLQLTDGDENTSVSGGASFSLQRRLQPASGALIGPFFREVPMGLRPTDGDEDLFAFCGASFSLHDGFSRRPPL